MLKNFHLSKLKTVLCILIGFFAIFGLFLRSYKLATIPASISNDEIDHVVNGMAIRHSHKDFQGQNYFWELMPTAGHTYTAELSALWHAFIPQLNLDPLLIARIPNLLAGIIAAIFFGIFAYQIFKSKLIGAFTFVGLLISPWHIFISRMSYEAPVSLAWLSMSLVFFWQLLSSNNSKNKIIFLIGTVITMFCSFYTYHGYKMIYPFLFLILFIWNQPKLCKLHSLKLKKLLSRFYPLIFVIIVWSLIFGLFMYRVHLGYYGERTSEISLLNKDFLSSIVNSKRRDSLASPYKHFFINRGTVLLDLSVSNLIRSFDLNILFHSGSDSYVLGMWEHGFLYLFQLPLILIGILWLFKYLARHLFFLSGLLFISLIPVLVHLKPSMTLRSNIFIPILIIFSAVGLKVVITHKYKFKRIIFVFLGVIVFLSVLRFQHFYFVRYPIQTIDVSMFDRRLATSYIKQIDKNRPVIFVGRDPFNMVRLYAFFSKRIDAESIADWQLLLNNYGLESYQYQNITFTKQVELVDFETFDGVVVATQEFANDYDLDKRYSLRFKDTQKENQQKVLILPSPRDNRDYYRVYNDSVCTIYKSPPFIDINDSNLFVTEALDKSQFCQTWTRTEEI